MNEKEREEVKRSVPTRSISFLLWNFTECDLHYVRGSREILPAGSSKGIHTREFVILTKILRNQVALE